MDDDASAALTSFSTALEEIEAKVKRLQRLPWSQICGPDMPPLDSARMHLMVAYAVNALFWMYLRARGEKNLAGHPVKAELERVKKALRRVKEAEAQQTAADEAAAASRALTAEQQRPFSIDGATAKRFVTAALCDGGTADGSSEPASADAAEPSDKRSGSSSKLAADYLDAARSSSAAAEVASQAEGVRARGAASKVLSQLQRAAASDASSGAAGSAEAKALTAQLLEFAEAHVDDEEEAVVEEKRSEAREKSPADGSGGKKRRRKDEKPEKKAGRPKKR